MATTMVTRIRTMTISTMTTIIKFMIVTMAMKNTYQDVVMMVMIMVTMM